MPPLRQGQVDGSCRAGIRELRPEGTVLCICIVVIIPGRVLFEQPLVSHTIPRHSTTSLYSSIKLWRCWNKNKARRGYQKDMESKTIMTTSGGPQCFLVTWSSSMIFLCARTLHFALVCMLRWIEDVYREFQEDSSLQDDWHPLVQLRRERY